MRSRPADTTPRCRSPSASPNCLPCRSRRSSPRRQRGLGAPARPLPAVAERKPAMRVHGLDCRVVPEQEQGDATMIDRSQDPRTYGRHRVGRGKSRAGRRGRGRAHQADQGIVERRRASFRRFGAMWRGSTSMSICPRPAPRSGWALRAAARRGGAPSSAIPCPRSAIPRSTARPRGAISCCRGCWPGWRCSL